ncbi:MAG: phosphoribosylglycinamide formyltransferase [Bacteroidia bacterium]|nr:phosphoribosylglycinamide formyltransferase [Bacteroidia bacterium]MCZ2249757.1 phosphoribosylglycinamide formyltransferase [Bacteroidia bacterium]
MKRLVIFASGNGSNAENIINYFKNKKHIADVIFVISNNEKAGVINRAKNLSVPVFVLKNKDFEQNYLIHFLKENRVDYIILAGFLRKISDSLIHEFPQKIINIHPSLLPKYGGLGMYGHKVHDAVIANNEKKSGISIHYVNEEYDKGKILFQKECEVSESDNADSLAQKIHQLEHRFFPDFLEQLLLNKL